ncbi:MAG: hypothetical protein ACI9J3_003893 [Parvicellaceae bacterium]|jgi:hypothetical protein
MVMSNLNGWDLACDLFTIAINVRAQSSGLIETNIECRISSVELEQIKMQLAEQEIELVVLHSAFVCDQLTYIDFKIVYSN